MAASQLLFAPNDGEWVADLGPGRIPNGTASPEGFHIRGDYLGAANQQGQTSRQVYGGQIAVVGSTPVNGTLFLHQQAGVRPLITAPTQAGQQSTAGYRQGPSGSQVGGGQASPQSSAGMHPGTPAGIPLNGQVNGSNHQHRSYVIPGGYVQF